MSRITRHLFVCRNERPVEGRPSCSARGSAEIFAALQKAIGGRQELWGQVAVTPCGCLGPCFDGPMLVIYPEGIWYRAVRAEDAAEIVESHLLGGRPVERLRHDTPDQDED